MRKRCWLWVAVMLMQIIAAPLQGAQRPLVVGVGKDSYVSAGPRNNLGRYPLNVGIFEPLTTFDDRYRLQPCLARRWKALDARRWRFDLRENVRFHDGTPLEAAHVALSLEKMQKTGTLLFNLDRIETVGPHAIDIITRTDCRNLPYILSHPILGIGRPGDTPIGTGPFVFDAYRRGQFIELTRNTAYWGEKARSQRVIFRFISDTMAGALAFRAGEVDVLVDVPWASLPEFTSDGNIHLHATPRGTYVGLMVSGKGASNDPMIRRALSMAMDRDAINQIIWQGWGRTGQTMIDDVFLGEHAALIDAVVYDPESARKILEAKKITLTLVCGFPNADAHGYLPQLLQQQFQEAGIDARLMTINDRGAYHDMVKSGKGDLWLERGSLNSADFTFLPYLLFYPSGFYVNQLQTPVGSKRFCLLLEQALASINQDELRKYTALALNEIINRDRLFIPIATIPTMIATQADVVLPSPHPTPLSIRWAAMHRREN